MSRERETRVIKRKDKGEKNGEKKLWEIHVIYWFKKKKREKIFLWTWMAGMQVVDTVTDIKTFFQIILNYSSIQLGLSELWNCVTIN